MLQKVKMVDIAPLLYTGVCNIIEREKYLKENKSTDFREVTVAENIPCRVSYSSKNSAKNTEDGAYSTTQTVKLFINNSIEIKTGSKIIVTQNNNTIEYSASGESAAYSGHQEIVLEKFKSWT